MAGRAGRWLVRALVGVLALGIAASVGVWTALPPTLVTAPPRSNSPLLISDVAVFDVRTGTVVPHQDVVVAGEAIESVGPHDPHRSAERRLDGRGRTLVPGLVDAHCHVLSGSAAPGAPDVPNPWLNFERLLYAGVTTVFDPGSDAGLIFEVRARLADETVLGPTLLAAGPIFTAPGGHPVPMVTQFVPEPGRDVVLGRLTRQVATEAEAAAAVDALVPSGPDFIKVAIDRLPDDAPRLDPEVAAAVQRAAADHGLRTVAHIGTLDDARAAAEVGVSAWIHGVYKARIPDDAIAELAAHGIPMVPTMVVFKAYAELAGGDYAPTALEAAVAPDALFASWADPSLSEDTPDNIRAFLENLRAQRASALDNVGRLHAAGVTILAGSDSQSGMLPGPSLHQELALLQRAGLSPAEVLQAATWLPAQFLEDTHDPSFGAVAEGKRADLVLVNGDPTTDVAVLADIHTVILRGRVLERTPWPE